MTERMTDEQFALEEADCPCTGLVPEARRAREAEAFLDDVLSQRAMQVYESSQRISALEKELARQEARWGNDRGQAIKTAEERDTLRARVERLEGELRGTQREVHMCRCNSNWEHPACVTARAALRDEQEKPPAPLGPFCSVEEWCARASGHDGACTTTQVLMARDGQEKGE